MSFHYHAFGLNILSCMALPELLSAPAGSTPEAEIVYGDVPAELPEVLARGVRYQSARDALRLQVDGVANYLVRDGRQIVIARDPTADDDDVRLFLLGSVLGALLHQRRDLVLHGSAIEWRGGCVVFLGNSGVGKSTLAAAFHKKGHGLVADDFCAVRCGTDGSMLAYPSFPHAKLWPDSLKQLDISPDGLKRLRKKLEKRSMPLGGNFKHQPLPVKKLYRLRTHNQEALLLAPVQGGKRFTVLKYHTYRFRFLAGIDEKAGHFQDAVKVARQASFAVVRRPTGSFRLDDLVALIESDLGV